ncbi:MAG TPA: SigE family RNA polymerase sigma factor [Jatrophihabitantaceae bacterium]|nr:SigE family RNA polymerase sigma factor [Jatrophihabitantaceae bacterium]
MAESGRPSVDAAQSLDDFVRARGDDLVRFAYVLTGGDVHQAQDLVQAALAKVMRRWPSIVAGGQPHAYLRRVVASLYVSARRRRSAGEVVISDLPDRQVPDVFDDVDARDAAWRLIAGLPKRQRTIVALRYLEGWSDEQIAVACGCSSATVRSQSSRALNALRERLGPRWTVTIGGERRA